MGLLTPTFSPDDLTTQSAPRQRWAWARPLVPKRLQPYLRGLRKVWVRRRFYRELEEPFRTIFPYTQVDRTRQRNLLRLAGIVEAERIEGAVVECGVLDGGTAALMAYGTAVSSRKVHLFDAWEGLPKTTEQDGADAKQWHGQVVGSPRRVRNVMNKLAIDPRRVVVHRGWFHETFPAAAIEKIALLHIDADFYEGTRLCFERWWPHVAPGGFVQIDDYDSFRGCRLAVDEFLAAHPEVTLESFGQFKAKARYFQKPAPLQKSHPERSEGSG